MTCAEDIGTKHRPAGRPKLARSRLETARGALSDCHLCAYRCRVNRFAGEHGVCRAGSEARVFITQVEFSDEPELSPTIGVALGELNPADEQIQPRTAAGVASQGEPHAAVTE